ncbi:DUF5689 domain-containing protein [Niabella beijingensis]|uniref:DUF5689 domain-containing protein n=1 Tax=Niabella beijingensis TaxID=2872700 RepID=UPI001CBECB4F|nr:DUF5689 domain-containing protein [Niabella beijingensis]MBZ4189264.1 DUF5689 domain-containing protein [Niabella beijingensis]
MKYIFNLFLVLSVGITINSCTKNTYENYPGGVPYEVVSVLDVRPLYKGQDITITKESVYGATNLAAVVVSDHTAGNIPEGLLIVQDSRRLNTIRGISIDMGAAAANYHPGDSLMIDIIGSTLTRKNGILTITGIPVSKIIPKGKGFVGINSITVPQLLANPDIYESSLCIINKSSLNPAPKPGDVISGAKNINDGFGDLTLYTDPNAAHANNTPLMLAAYVGIPFKKTDGSVELRTREGDDIVDMGTSAQDLIITGIQSDPKGGDGGNEYVQIMATRDIDFSVTPYSIVFCNNAGASTPTTLDAGWATGGKRTIKWDITSGTALKGKFFYFGFQNRKINGNAGTVSFPEETNWYGKTYLNVKGGPTNPGDGGLVRTSVFTESGPFANSGNACGVALFKGTSVTEASVPEDVLFIASGGNTGLYDPSKNPIQGYRICNNDWYSMYSIAIDPDTYKPVIVPYLHYRSAGNTTNMPYPVNAAHPDPSKADAGLFSMMGGVYNITLGRWTTARKQVVIELFQKTEDGHVAATIADIENDRGGPNDSLITRIVE